MDSLFWNQKRSVQTIKLGDSVLNQNQYAALKSSLAAQQRQNPQQAHRRTPAVPFGYVWATQATAVEDESYFS